MNGARVHIGTPTDGVDIECVGVEAPGSHREGDLHLIVSVRAGDFAGRTDPGIDRDAWAAFLTALRELERTRKGSATLEGLSPGELRLTVRAIDRAGHMSIEGLVSVLSPHRARRLEFAPIEFDPGNLAGIIRELGKFSTG